MLSRFRKQQNATSPEAKEPTPHVEIWDHFVKTHRFFKWIAVGALVLAGLGLAGGAYGMLTALHAPLVFAVDAEGDAHPLGRREGLFAPADAEIRYVAKRFLQKTLAFHSETIESDLADAMNLMTDELRKEMEREFQTYAEEKGQPFVPWVKAQQIRTSLDINSMTTENHGDRAWSVRIKGRVTTWPLREIVRQAQGRARDVEAQLTLVRVPRTDITPHGVLVSASATRFFKVPSTRDDLEQKVQPRSDSIP
jgi:type IV secretory pathway TrbF-like protein